MILARRTLRYTEGGGGGGGGHVDTLPFAHAQSLAIACFTLQHIAISLGGKPCTFRSHQLCLPAWQKDVKCLQADIEAYTTEMEVVGTAYEDMQAKNSRLLQQVSASCSRLFRGFCHEFWLVIEPHLSGDCSRRVPCQVYAMVRDNHIGFRLNRKP